MNQIGVKQTISTVEIADMMDTNHRTILRKLEGRELKGKRTKGIIEVLTESHLGVSDFFIEGTYKDASGKINKCYHCTRKGCEFLAHKFQGEKGILFTAHYINRFHDMEQVLQQQQPVQAELPQKEKEQYLLKDSQTWFSKNNWKMQILCRDFRWERKYLYHKILTELSDIYNLKGIEKEYVQKKGHAPVYKMELVEFYEPLQGVASQSV